MSKTARLIVRNFGKYDPDSLKGYESIGGFRTLCKVLIMGGCGIVDVLAANDARGRGDAAYDTSKKWRQAQEVPGAHECVVCNADEDEPGTFKDRGLLTHDPFQLLEDMTIAGWAVGADSGYTYLWEEYPHLWPRLFSAITQCEAADCLGGDVLGSGLNYRIHLHSDAGAYVCGEGSALAESISDHTGRLRMKLPFIRQCGVFHLPTCVSNMEPLSLMTPLSLDGEDYYKSQGTPDCLGTKIVSVCGSIKCPGVFEAPFDITIRETVYDLADGTENENHPLRLVQFSSALGRTCSPAQLGTFYTYKGVRRADLTAIGSGAVLVVGERTSITGFLRMTQEFSSHKSCGQYIPCQEGSHHISLLLDRVAEDTHAAQGIATLGKFVDIMFSAPLCGLGETAQSALLNCVGRFPEVFAVKKGVTVR